MREYFADGLPLRRSIQSAVIQDLAKPRLIKTFHEVENARVLGGSRRLQRCKIVEYDRVQFVGMVTHAGTSRQTSLRPFCRVLRSPRRCNEPSWRNAISLDSPAVQYEAIANPGSS